jgi:hypothetical protein
MDWEHITHFKPSEFPSQKEIDLTEPRLFKTLDGFRVDLGYPIYPSPVKGALAREYGSKTSRHYAIGRLSTAVDIFPDCSVYHAFIIATQYFGGVGVYFDTHFKGRKWIMLHVDLRQTKTHWYRDDHIYHTLNTEKDYNKLFKRLKQ